MSFFIQIRNYEKESLYFLREYPFLRVATDAENLWLADFDENFIKLPQIIAIKNLVIYREEANILFPINSRLPAGKVPEVLWTPIAHFLPVTKPKYNHNFFGIHDRLSINLTPYDTPQPIQAILSPLNLLKDYITGVPRFRYGHLKWVQIGEEALVFGSPSASMQGKSYWQLGFHLLPEGYHFEFPLLADTIRKVFRKSKDSMLLWELDGSHTAIPFDYFTHLAPDSFAELIR
ncbi:MAG: hypothetical protein H6607_06340 [Flavobacteriales bacterium]|nr:hypothetical protein [Flavobacteriales bacterium]